MQCLHNEGMAHGPHDLLFVIAHGQHVLSTEIAFGHHLHRVQKVGVCVLAQVNFAEPALLNQFQWSQILHS